MVAIGIGGAYVRSQIMGVHPFASSYGMRGDSDGMTVLQDGLSFPDIVQRDLVPCIDRFAQRHGEFLTGDDASPFERLQRDCYRVLWFETDDTKLVHASS